MDDNRGGLEVLTDKQCWNLLGRQQLGRLVTNVDRALDIFPVNYVVDGQSIVFRTAEGTKLVELTVNDEVLFEVDDHTDTNAWSVVVRGYAHRISSAEEVASADRLPLKPWVPTLKHNYVRIAPTGVSGRAFSRGDEPDRHGAQQY